MPKLRSCIPGLATLVALSVAACSDGGAPQSPTEPVAEESALPSPTPSWETFTSDRHRYSIGYPAGWEVREHPGEVSLAGLRPRRAGTDTISTPDSHRFDSLDGVVVITARELLAGETIVEFTDEASEATPCGPPFGYDTTSLDVETAEYRKFDCGNNFWVQITAAHEGRGYLVWLVSNTAPRADRRPINDQFLESFRFTD